MFVRQISAAEHKMVQDYLSYAGQSYSAMQSKGFARESVIQQSPALVTWLLKADTLLTSFGKSKKGNSYIDAKQQSDGGMLVNALIQLRNEIIHGDALRVVKQGGLSYGPEGKGLVYPISYGDDGRFLTYQDLLSSVENRVNTGTASKNQLRAVEKNKSIFIKYIERKYPQKVFGEALDWMTSYAISDINN